jgi:hypothetical protein
VRIGTGFIATCGTLSAVPLYRASLAWQVQRLPGTENEPPHWLSGAMPGSIAATSTGLVVAGVHLKNDCSREPVNRTWSCRPPTRYATAVWTSADGISWSEQILAADTGAGLVAAGPVRSVIVASGAAWWSSDGRSWIPASRPPTMRKANGSVVATGAGFVAVGAAVAADAGTATTRAWTSSGGDTWTPSPQDPDLAPLCVSDLVATPSKLVAVGSDCSGHAAITVSGDGGLTWGRPALGSAFTGSSGLEVVTSGPSGLVVYGSREDGAIGAWASSDGLAWRATSTVPHATGWDSSWVSDAVPYGPGTVLVGGSAAAADWLGVDVLVSGDGLVLRRAPWPPSNNDSTMAAAATWNGRLYVVGTGNAYFMDPAIPLLWTAELGPAP